MIQTDLSPHLPSRQPVVLFVDDDHRILRGVERLFRQAHVPWGYAFAGGADEALALLTDREVDAMISDVRMPGHDGFELLARIRSVLQLKRYQDIIKCQNSHLEELVRRRTESLAATRLEMAAEIAGCHHE